MRPSLLALLSSLLLTASFARADKPHSNALQFDQGQSALEEGSVHAVESKTHATLHFVNLTSKELALFWLDFKGKRRPYGKIPAGGEVTHATYLTHPWLVARTNGHGLAVFLPQGSDSTVLIDPMSAPKRPDDNFGIRSEKGKEATTLRFVNPTDQAVDLYWLDYQGQRVARGHIAAHSELKQPTFATHAWLVANPSGTAQAVFVARATPQTALIAPDTSK